MMVETCHGARFEGPQSLNAATHLTVGMVVKYLLPNGTRAGQKYVQWKLCPLWGPDVFAIAATLLEKSGCYAEPGIAFSTNAVERRRKLSWAIRARKLGRRWANRIPPPSVVHLLWGVIYRRFNEPICGTASEARLWKIAASRLLAISDEACSGFGWLPSNISSEANKFLFKQYFKALGQPGSTLVQTPHSLAFLVPSDVACVQPKANTPQVGCTIRSLSHNLALLPGRGVVETEWHLWAKAPDVERKENSGEKLPFNILLIPFPYVIHGTDFAVSRHPEDEVDGYFSISQRWLSNNGKPIEPAELAGFVLRLVNAANRDVGRIDCVVFPEASLNPSLAEEAAKLVAEVDKSIELMIFGTLERDGTVYRNQAQMMICDNGKIIQRHTQRKHHRWKLEGIQIKNYHLGNALHPDHSYWEDIELDRRKLAFGVFRNDAVITALVCEDLARADPVMPVLSSIGPTLVVALLMDGPQLIGRWSGRYATVLADDPGAAILTLTSLGMVLRSRVPGSPLPTGTTRRCVALWREPGGDSHEIDLPQGHHGLVLSLSPHNVKQRTLDSRDDDKMALRFTLSAVRPIKLAETPAWLETA